MNEKLTRLGRWRIQRTLVRDVSGTYYAGERDDGERATLYLLADELTDARRAPVLRLLELHRGVDHPGLVRFHGLEHDDGDAFLIGDAVEPALASLRSAPRPDPGHTRAFGAALAAALGAAHDRGLVHGGLELDHVLWAPAQPPRILGTGVAALGNADHAALAHGDVAGLGRLLCALLAGWQPRAASGPWLTADRETLELVRALAEPAAAMSMRDAHALLAANDPEHLRAAARRFSASTTAALGSAGASGQPARAGGTGPTADHVPRGSAAGTSGGDAPAEPDRPGSQLSRYRVLTRLGHGGMGEVLLAEDPVLRRCVAIKRIRAGLERDRTFRARLRREAQLAARLSHRAIVQVFDLVTTDNVDHVVMEYVAGPSLHTLLGGGAMAITEVVRLATEIADGLAYAHQQGVVHRDLKLENILIGTDGQPKIADFGIARRVASAGDAARLGGSEPEESLTRDGVVVGTSRAMSPEQIQGQDIDARSDLFSFGVMLYELVTGKSPFAAGVDAVTLLRVLNDRQAPACEVAPEVPRALSDLIDHLLEKTPAARPASAALVRDRLRHVLDADSDPQPRPRTSPRSDALPTEGMRAAMVGAEATPTRGERRQVTLACIDLVGAGADELSDPEILADVLPTFRAQVDDILAEFDGVLISALGHRFVACFGHPRPLEDAARRAVLAGRAMLAAATGLSSLDPVHTQARFTARGSVHTGLAVIRGRGTSEELVLGATLDTALRLLHLGGTGDLWLSEATVPLVASDFQLERPATLPEGATAARRLVATPTTGTTTRGGSGAHDRPMVARDHEMQLLLDGWQRASQGEGQAALLIGDPGIGKSRLTRELAAAIGKAGDEPRQVRLRGSSHRQRSAFDAAADAVAGLLGFEAGAAGEDNPGATQRLRAATGPDEAEQILRLLGRPAQASTAPPERARQQLLGGLRDVLLGAGDEAPTLLIVEDLHWLDPSTLDLIALLLREVAASPVFLLMTTRPGFQPPWPLATAVTQLRLGRLDAVAIDAVIAHACRDRVLSAAERALIASRSEGVPLYAEELVRAALELGRAGEIPSTLRDALTARLHQLGSAATRVAHVAAIAGREFTSELIAAVGGLERAAVDRELDRLVAAEILLRRRGRNRVSLYQFGHVLLQQAAYEELLAGDRRQLHGQLADLLLEEERAGRDPGVELIANQLAGARRFGDAIAVAHRAALGALGRHARVEARELLRQALTWLEQLPPSDARDRTEIGLRMQLAAVLIATEGYTSTELERSCRRTETLCERHDDMPLPVKYGLWAVRLMRGSADEVAPFLAWFERVIDRGGPPVDRMMAHASIGTYTYARADYAQAYHHLERAMALFEPAEHRGVVQLYGGCGGFYGHLLMIGTLWQSGRLDEAWRHMRSTIAQAEALDPYALASAMGWEMSLYRYVGDVASMEATAERMLAITTRYEFPFLACSALCYRGWALARRGQAERAITDLVTGTKGSLQIGVKVLYPYCLGMYAEAAIGLGQLDRAAQALDEGLEVCRTSVDRGHEPELLRLSGRLILARDASARPAARAAFTDALATALRHGARTLALRAAIDLAQLLCDERLPHEAIAVLDPVYRGFTPGLEDPHLAAARALLAELAAGA